MSYHEWTHPEHVDHRTPIDELEPLHDAHSDMRDFALRSVQILHAFANLIECAIAREKATVLDVALAYWQGAYALGLPSCDVSMTARAVQLGCERASISKGSTAFCAANDLDPSWAMRREAATISYTKARVDSVKQSMALPPHQKAKPFKTPPSLPK